MIGSESGHTYFAYGSNLLRVRIETRVGSCVLHGRAELRGYRLSFSKLGKDGSGKCNIEATGGDSDVVHGVLYGLEDAQREALDRFEGGYEYASVEVLLPGAERAVAMAAGTYVARPESISRGAVPFDWYLGYVTAGAREQGLPDAYLQWLESHPLQSHADVGRLIHHRHT
ncbi:MAG: gamma-glutamylcyclotransferase family protein [Gammaproteobacteria bacterium]